MITFDAQWIDVTKFLLTQEQPVAIVPRQRAHTGPKAWAGTSEVGRLGEFWVPVSSILDGDVQFSRTKSGEGVRVPMFAYETAYRLLPSIFGLGIQIGMLALDEMRKQTGDAPLHVLLILGHECTDLAPANESYRCYVGIAIQTK